jgi:hypothetical protein
MMPPTGGLHRADDVVSAAFAAPSGVQQGAATDRGTAQSLDTPNQTAVPMHVYGDDQFTQQATVGNVVCAELPLRTRSLGQ